MTKGSAFDKLTFYHNAYFETRKNTVKSYQFMGLKFVDCQYFKVHGEVKFVVSYQTVFLNNSMGM